MPFCSSCKNYVSADEKVCLNCGFNFKIGVVASRENKTEEKEIKDDIRLNDSNDKGKLVSSEGVDKNAKNTDDIGLTDNQRKDFNSSMLYLIGFMLIVIILVGSVYPPGAIIFLVIGTITMYIMAIKSKK